SDCASAGCATAALPRRSHDGQSRHADADLLRREHALLLARLGPLGEPRHQAADAALEHVEEAVTPVRRAVDDDPDHVRLLLAAAPDAGRALGDRGAALG